MIIANFTPDDIPWMHIGVNGVIPAYDPDDPEKKHIVEMDEGRAKFILTTMGRRGLVQMQFNDDVEKKKRQSEALYHQFWEDQITTQNQINEDQREKGNRYAKPSEELIEHAERLGIEILKPWTVKKAEDPEAIRILKKENDDLKKSVTDMGEQMNKMMEMMKRVQPSSSDEVNNDSEPPPGGVSLEKEEEANRRRYKSLREGTMKGWLRNNWDEIQEMPEKNRFEIETLYRQLYQTPYPEEKPE